MLQAQIVIFYLEISGHITLYVREECDKDLVLQNIKMNSIYWMFFTG